MKPRYVIQAFCALSFCIPFTSPLIRNTTVIVISFSNNKLNLSEVNFIISPWDIGSPPFYNWWWQLDTSDILISAGFFFPSTIKKSTHRLYRMHSILSLPSQLLTTNKSWTFQSRRQRGFRKPRTLPLFVTIVQIHCGWNKTQPQCMS